VSTHEYIIIEDKVSQPPFVSTHQDGNHVRIHVVSWQGYNRIDSLVAKMPVYPTGSLTPLYQHLPPPLTCGCDPPFPLLLPRAAAIALADDRREAAALGSMAASRARASSLEDPLILMWPTCSVKSLGEVTSCHVMSRHVTSCHVMSCHVMSCQNRSA
jgi:hypothetical protein